MKVTEIRRIQNSYSESRNSKKGESQSKKKENLKSFKDIMTEVKTDKSKLSL